MVTVTDALFLTVVAFLFVHELDAIRQREWRFFFAPTTVRDVRASQIFIALHAPLLVVLLGYLDSTAFQLGFDVFAIAHGIVHFGLRNHPLVAFENWFSRIWIFGGSLLGVTHLLFVL
ncbi:DUF6713 family protein (plasmid) [Haloferax sp. S1W]|uniref:DUF6713 family protein n=1 Tax=Haloferax sp. S1W TaxID=3377110 RepID=UPI0037C7BB3F